MGADQVVPDLPLRIHDIDRRNGSKAVVRDDLQVVFRGQARAGIGGVALDDGAVHFLHQGADQFGLEVVVSARFPVEILTVTRPVVSRPRAS